MTDLVTDAAIDAATEGPLNVAIAPDPASDETAAKWMEDKLLTNAEHLAVEYLALAWNVYVGHITEDVSASDTKEFQHNIHAAQNMILAQAAARAYPNRYRLLGGRLAGDE